VCLRHNLKKIVARQKIIDLRGRIGNSICVRGNRLGSHGKVVSPLKDHPRSVPPDGGIPFRRPGQVGLGAALRRVLGCAARVPAPAKLANLATSRANWMPVPHAGLSGAADEIERFCRSLSAKVGEALDAAVAVEYIATTQRSLGRPRAWWSAARRTRAFAHQRRATRRQSEPGAHRSVKRTGTTKESSLSESCSGGRGIGCARASMASVSSSSIGDPELCTMRLDSRRPS
jgi:hypothetical protein